MPEETPEQIAAREAASQETPEQVAAAAAAAAAGSGADDAVAQARAAANTARQEAETAKASATAEQASLAAERSSLADEKLALAERAAKAGDKSFPPEVVEKLRGEAAGYRTKLRDAEVEVQRLKDVAKTDIERLTGEAKSFEQRAVEAEKKLLRLSVGQKAGLAPELAERLIGDDEDSLKKDAAKLLKLQGTPAGGLDQGARGGGTRPAAGAGAPDGKGAMNDFLRSHGGRREIAGGTSSTSA
jgi:colicin import membrane protein